MAGIKERVYLNDSKSHVRQKLDLQGREKDEGFCTWGCLSSLFYSPEWTKETDREFVRMSINSSFPSILRPSGMT
jgi:hypothetical protein